MLKELFTFSGLRLTNVGSWVTSSNNRGQVILRHPDSPAYRCFLPDLAGFTGFCCTGPSPFPFGYGETAAL